MKNPLSLLFTAVITLTSLSAAPSIAPLGVKNSASYANSAFPNGAIAQGSLFVVFGSGLGPGAIQYSSSFPLPNTLAGTSASVTVSGTTLACIMIYTSDGQIAAVLPSMTPVGTGAITVSYNGVASPTAPIKVVANSPGLFTRSQQGSGPGVIQDANGVPNGFTNSFNPAQTVVFWGTGLGPIGASDALTPPSGNLSGTNVTALVGGQTAVVQYAGRSSYAGVDQINVTIPSGTSGCFVSVGIFVNGIPANFTSISVAPTGKICSDANLFTAADIQRIAAGNPLRLGTALLSQYTATGTLLGQSLKIDYETGKSYYMNYSPDLFLNSLSGLADLAVSPGSCAVFQYANGTFVDPVPAPGMDAGAQINVGGSQVMKNSVLGHYQGTFSNANPLSPSPAFLKPGGTYSVDNGTGGKDVGAFKFNATLPAAISWTNKPTGNIPRSQDLKVTWTGGDPASFVYVFGQSPIESTGNTGAEFICVGSNSDGALTVPTAVLSSIPASANTTLAGYSVPGGILVVNSTTITRQTAPGTDIFLMGTSTGDAKGAFAFQ